MIWQAVIAAIIIAAAAYGLYRSLRRNKPQSGCSDCPLAADCKKKSQKSDSKSCKNQN